jgi:Transposase DDE domain.
MWKSLPKQGNSSTAERMALMERFISLLGLEKLICLVADREFIGAKWFSYLIKETILFRIRIKNDTRVSTRRGKPVPVRNLFRDLRPGTYKILNGKRRVWGLELYVIGLKMTTGEWVILVTQDEPETARTDYKERWQIETLFGCLKTRGFHFESTHITRLERIDRLLAYLAIAFCWAHLTGEWLVEQKPIRMKKHQRPAKSIFRCGLDYLRNCLLNLHETIKQVAFNLAIGQLLKRFYYINNRLCYEKLSCT